MPLISPPRTLVSIRLTASSSQALGSQIPSKQSPLDEPPVACAVVVGGAACALGAIANSNRQSASAPAATAAGARRQWGTRRARRETPAPVGCGITIIGLRRTLERNRRATRRLLRPLRRSALGSEP